MISKAIKLLGEQGRNHGHDCVLVILEETKAEVDEHQLDDVISKDYPIIINTPSTLSKDIFSTCSSIVSILPNQDGNTYWLSELPARHKIIFATDDLTSIRQFPRLKRLPLSEFFIYEKNGTFDADGRYDQFSVHKWEGYHSNDMVEVAMCTGENFDCDYRDAAGSMDFHLQTDYKGHEFPAVAFEFFPYSMPDFETQVHSGFEYMIVKVLTDALNLKMVVRPPTSGGMWGWQKEDGNYTGR